LIDKQSYGQFETGVGLDLIPVSELVVLIPPIRSGWIVQILILISELVGLSSGSSPVLEPTSFDFDFDFDFDLISGPGLLLLNSNGPAQGAKK